MIFADTETTGLDTLLDNVVSLCMIKVDDETGEIIDTRNQYFNPRVALTEEATKVNGLTNEKLEHFPVFSDVADKIIEYVSRDTIVFHNAPFDMGILNSEFNRCGKSVDWNVIDSLELARNVMNSGHIRVKHNLNALADYYKVDNLRGETHSSLADTKMLAEIYPLLVAHKQKLIEEKKYWEYKKLCELLKKQTVVLTGATSNSRTFGGPCSTKFLKPAEIGEIWQGKITVFSFVNHKKITLWLNSLSVKGVQAY